MTDALSEALMKLSAAKPVQGSGAASTVEATQRSSSAENAERSPVPAAMTGLSLPEVETPPKFPPAAPVRAAAPPPGPAAARNWIVKIRELRGWVAAGIGLAVLFTIVDDLRKQDSSARIAGPAANASVDVDLDELLHEFETAEPSTRPQRKESRPAELLPETESSVTADYGSSESDIEAVSATSDSGSGVVRFTGRIEPLN
ncbi:MAG: hypothetical protein ACKO2L_02195 [Planctomycetaceae bacterium]